MRNTDVMGRRAPTVLLTLILAAALGGVVAAQSDDTGELAPPIFAIVMDPADIGSGVFTEFFVGREQVAGGSVATIEAEQQDGSLVRLLRLSPHSSGGDTLDLRIIGPVPEGGAPGMPRLASLKWDIGSGSGDLASLTGSGDLLTSYDSGVEIGTGFYHGIVHRAGDEMKARAWRKTPLLVISMDPVRERTGTFTPFADLDGGTVELIEDLTDFGAETIGGVFRLDPAPPGGDTIDIRMTGGVGVDPQSIAFRAWRVIAGTGALEDIIGRGDAVAVVDPGTLFDGREPTNIALLTGSTGRAIADVALAQKNWKALKSRFKLKKLQKRSRDIARTQQYQTKKLRKLQKQWGKDIDFVTGLGVHRCYAEAADQLVRGLEGVVEGIGAKADIGNDADVRLFAAYAELEEFDAAARRVKC
jgi:hypothetical protein